MATAKGNNKLCHFIMAMSICFMAGDLGQPELPAVSHHPRVVFQGSALHVPGIPDQDWAPQAQEHLHSFPYFWRCTLEIAGDASLEAGRAGVYHLLRCPSNLKESQRLLEQISGSRQWTTRSGTQGQNKQRRSKGSVPSPCVGELESRDPGDRSGKPS